MHQSTPCLLLAKAPPNPEAVALSPTVGWLLLAAALCVASLGVVHRQAVRRWFFDLEDPRPMAAFRIAFGICVLLNVTSMAEHWRFLFTDEGLFTADVARQVHAAHQFAGFGDGMGPDDPWGFFDLRAVARWLGGPSYSLLMFWDNPAFFTGYMVAFYVAGVALVVGYRTRTAGVLTWVLMNGLFLRNRVFWEGTEVMYRCFLAYLIVARSGATWSVDAWLRRRRDPATEDPSIPAWPRRLVMLQLATVYTTTGFVKTGAVWARGDALYYALNMDHFYRVPPQMVSAALGTNLFRVATWVVHWWEAFFPLLLVGMVVRWAHRERIPPLPRRAVRLARGLWITLAAVAGAIGVVTWPVVHTPFGVGWFIVSWVAGVFGVGFLWWKLGHGGVRVRGVVIDRLWVARWILGRRVWLTLSVVFHGSLFTFMNIGHFQTGMLAVNFAFLHGPELGRLAQRLARRLGIGVREPETRVDGLAYGRIGRALIGTLIAWHITAVAIWLVPARNCTSTWRPRARAKVARWLTVTQTDQGWGMFAPNPPRQNVFRKVLVTDAHGEVWDMRTDMYAEEHRPVPLIFYDRMRKVNRRIIGGESGGGSWYRKWYARWQCREWERTHGGTPARTVELVKIWYPIPSPEQVSDRGHYDPVALLARTGRERLAHTEHCATTVMGQLPPWVRARHGLPEAERPYRPWIKHRQEKWERRLAARGK